MTACGRAPRTISAASAFNVVIDATAASTTSASGVPRFTAVATIPVPIRFERTSTSPSRPPPFVHTSSGCTNPVTAMPYLGSGSSIEWPPATTAPAARATSAPPRRISPRSSIGSVFGNATTFRANAGRPPIA